MTLPGIFTKPSGPCPISFSRLRGRGSSGYPVSAEGPAVIPQMLAAPSVVDGERCSLRKSRLRRDASLFGHGACLRLVGEPPHDVDQLVVGIAGRIAEVCERMRIGQLAQANEFADALPPVQLEFGSAMSEQDPPQLAVAKEMVEFCR